MSVLAEAKKAIAWWLLKAAFPNPIPYREHVGRWRSDGAVAAPSQEAYQDYAQIYENYVWVRVAVDKNAANVASVPVRVIDQDGEEIDHPITDLFQTPNPAMSYINVWQAWVVDMMLAGEAFWQVVPDRRGRPAELWPRRPDRIGVVPDADQRAYLGVAGYKFEQDTEDVIELPPEAMVHFKFYNPLNPYRGLRPIAAIRQGIIIDIFAQTWTKKLFQRGARPDYAIQLPEDRRLTPTMLKERQTYIDEHFRGVEKAHGIMILEHGEQVIPFSFGPEDAQYIEQRAQNRDEIGALFGVPDEVMGFGRNTYENYQFALEAYWRLTLLPLLRHRDETATNFCRRIGALKPTERLASDLSGIQALQKNINEQIEGAGKLWGMGVPFNLAAQVVGLEIEPIPGGNTGYIPFTLQPMGGMPAPQEPKKGNISTEIKGLILDYGSPAHEALWKSFIGLTEPRERKFIAELKRQFQRQQIEAGRRLRQFKPEERAIKEVVGAEALIDQEEEVEVFIDAFETYFQETVIAGAEAGLAELGLEIDFNPEAPSVRKIIETMTIRFARQVNETTIAKLRAELAAGAEAGESIPHLMERIGRVFEGRKSDYEAERIARTEINKAANSGHVAGYEQSGVVQEKEWLAALDNRTREAHMAAHGQRVPLQADFEVGGEYLNYPGDPKGSPGNIIFCRCRVVAAV